MHLNSISRAHTEAKFVKIDAEKCPFFVAKLMVQCLPTIVLFIDGIAVDRVVGFEELGGKDEFPELLLTRRLISGGVLMSLNKKEKGEIKINKGGKGRKNEDSDSDSN